MHRLTHSLFSVLNFVLHACRPDFAEIAFLRKKMLINHGIYYFPLMMVFTS